MSLLPETILPPSQPIGRANPDGTVTIDKNWFLLLYNICEQVLGNGKGLSAAQLTELTSTDIDVADTDAISLRQPIANLAVPQDATIYSAELPDIARALLLAQDALLTDPIPRAQPVQSITPSGSPFAYTALFPGAVAITGGTVSAVTIARQGTSVNATTGVLPVARLDVVTVTYSAAPTMTFLPF